LAFQRIPNGTVTDPSGFAAGAVACGLKESGDLDLALLYSEQNCTAAGVFTKSQVVAAPVILDRETLNLNKTQIRGVVANAGCANACTGAQGLTRAREMQSAAAALFDCRPEQFLVLSTGVIGVPLTMERVTAGLNELVPGLSADNGEDAARAIMTTDTLHKQIAVRLLLPDGKVTIGGMAKGSGMIHPDMATMLATLTTDAAIPADTLQALLDDAIENSFNCISVDGDTSTNDTVLLLANGASGVTLEDEASRDKFAAAFNHVCLELAKMIVRDGEGVSKFVEIRVTGAATVARARQVASTITISPLVKTALAGSDPNWGRILMAAGRAGVPLDQEQLALWISNPEGPTLLLVKNGTPTNYQESDAATIFAMPEINIVVDLGQGNREAIMWTGDLTHEYVAINADYRT
jgi:glutamate N-acetyltransferase/amino-acid N-acetyltransferase